MREVSTSSRVSSSVFLQDTGVFAMSLTFPMHFAYWVQEGVLFTGRHDLVYDFRPKM